MDLTARQSKILAAIIKEYNDSCRPVASSDLVASYDFGVSSATIRNEMATLEKAGLIEQPHTSAGRVPTNFGYRYFVKKLMKHMELTHREQDRLRHELLDLKRDYLQLGQKITKLLADQTKGAAFALLPHSVSTTGFSNIIDEKTPPKELRELARMMEDLEDYDKPLSKRQFSEVETFIGREAPLPISSDFSLVVSRVILPDGSRGVIGVVGPKRMKYEKNISLLEYISKLLAGGIGIALIINSQFSILNFH